MHRPTPLASSESSRTLAPCLLAGALLASPVAATSASLPLSLPLPRVAQDDEFDEGSWVPTLALDDVQVENLAVLCKLWGYLKYHHPLVTSGELRWDYELFRILPEMLDVAGPRERGDALASWVASIGAPEPCEPCAEDPVDVHLAPDLDWIGDRERLGDELVGLLADIHANRSVGPNQHIDHAPGVGNPIFDAEDNYADMGHPDAGFRLLGLFRYWNVIEYWFPYRDLLDEDWDAVLRDVIPRFMAAEEHDAYRLEFLALIARVHDTHANLWSSLDVQPPRGACYPPVRFRFIEGRAVVAGYSHEELGPATGLALGDVVTAIDGASIEAIVAERAPLYPASNEPTRLRDIARKLAGGDCGPVTLTVEDAAGTRDVVVERIPANELRVKRTHDREGETYQELSDDVAYLKLSSIRRADVPGYLERAMGKRGLVIDIRNYPSEFVVFALGGCLIDEPHEFTRFTGGDPSNPGAFRMTPPLRVVPSKPHFDGKVAILLDEVSQSQAEYTSMSLRVDDDAIVVGSTTAAADGNVSRIPLPGRMQTMISGIGVFYPDGTPTQRVGIVPDIEALPTIAGVRAGRDEVLEAALRAILGPDADEDEIRTMALRPTNL